MKKISLADLLIKIKQYKGQIAEWTKRLQISIHTDATTKAEYSDSADYEFKECKEQIEKLKKYLNYLKNLRNDKSQEQIKASYEIAELKDYNATLSNLHIRKKTDKRIGNEYVEIALYQPFNKKELDKLILENQFKINELQSSITYYNNNTFIEVEEYVA